MVLTRSMASDAGRVTRSMARKRGTDSDHAANVSKKQMLTRKSDVTSAKWKRDVLRLSIRDSRRAVADNGTRTCVSIYFRSRYSIFVLTLRRRRHRRICSNCPARSGISSTAMSWSKAHRSSLPSSPPRKSRHCSGRVALYVPKRERSFTIRTISMSNLSSINR